MTTELSAAEVRGAFHQCAQTIGYDVWQACEEMGEPCVLYRDTVVDYLYIHGGEKGKEVYDWVLKGNDGKPVTDEQLDAMSVPREWTP